MRDKIRFIGGGVINYCDSTVGVFLDTLQEMEYTDLSTTKGYNLIKVDINAMLELFRISLRRSFGMEANMQVKYKDVEILTTRCVADLSEMCNEVKRKAKSSVEINIFIQGCITEFIVVKNYRERRNYLCRMVQ